MTFSNLEKAVAGAIASLLIAVVIKEALPNPKTILSGDVEGRNYSISESWGGGKITEVQLTNGTKINYRDRRPFVEIPIERLEFQTYRKGTFVKDSYGFGDVDSFEIYDGTNKITNLGNEANPAFLSNATIEVRSAARVLLNRITQETEAKRQALLNKLEQEVEK